MLDIMQYILEAFYLVGKSVMRKNQNLKEVNVVWYDPAWPSQKPFF